MENWRNLCVSATRATPISNSTPAFDQAGNSWFLSVKLLIVQASNSIHGSNKWNLYWNSYRYPAIN